MSIFYVKQELDEDLKEFSLVHPVCCRADLDSCGNCIEVSSILTDMKLYFCENKKIYESCNNK